MEIRLKYANDQIGKGYANYESFWDLNCFVGKVLSNFTVDAKLKENNKNSVIYSRIRQNMLKFVKNYLSR